MQLKALRRRHKRGFTLIEMMLVVAIIGVIAAIAIPQYMRFQLKSKTAEGKVNLAAIRTAEAAYLSEFGAFVAADAAPSTAVSSVKQDWPVHAGGFDTIGWKPEGAVFFQYAIAINSDDGYTASAIADLDDDGTAQAWAFVMLDGNGQRVPAVHDECEVAQIASPTQIGPCDTLGAEVYGNSEF